MTCFNITIWFVHILKSRRATWLNVLKSLLLLLYRSHDAEDPGNCRPGKLIIFGFMRHQATFLGTTGAPSLMLCLDFSYFIYLTDSLVFVSVNQSLYSICVIESGLWDQQQKIRLSCGSALKQGSDLLIVKYQLVSSQLCDPYIFPFNLVSLNVSQKL